MKQRIDISVSVRQREAEQVRAAHQARAHVRERAGKPHVDVDTFAGLYVGSVFIVRRHGVRGKFVKLNPGCSIDENGRDAIFDWDTPVKLIGRAKICVIDYSA